MAKKKTKKIHVLMNRLAEHIAVKERQTGRRISNRQIAKDTDIAKTTVDAYIRNDREQYDRRIVIKLCEYLGVDPVTEFFVIITQDVEEDDPSPEIKNPLLVPA